MKKMVLSLICAVSLLTVPDLTFAASVKEAEVQVEQASKQSRILHSYYTQKADYKTLISTPYTSARIEVAEADAAVRSLPASQRKAELEKSVLGYKKVLGNANAYNNAVKSGKILMTLKGELETTMQGAHYSPPYFYQYDRFRHKINVLQGNFTKVYGASIQNGFKAKYLHPSKSTLAAGFYSLNADSDLKQAKKLIQKNLIQDAESKLNEASLCLAKVPLVWQSDSLKERQSLYTSEIHDAKQGIYRTFIMETNSQQEGIEQKDRLLQLTISGRVNLWITDKQSFHSAEDLTQSYSYNKVYLYREIGGRLIDIQWKYRDYRSAWETNIVHGYNLDLVEYIDKTDKYMVPKDTDLILVVEKFSSNDSSTIEVKEFN